MEMRDRLRWRCRRGMRELDLLLLGFVDCNDCRLGSDELRAFQRLLDYPDGILLELLMGRAPPPDGELASVIGRIRNAAARKT
jgi:antitoxin CptB